jgi:uncharacterized protein (DUF433 family)
MFAKILDKHIEITLGVVGGKPRIAGHRITVQNIVVWHEHLGQGLDVICTEHDLSLAAVHAALAYYFDHREEVDQCIAEDEVFIKALQHQSSSPLQEKLKKQGRE